MLSEDVIDEVDVAVIFLASHAVPDFGGVDEVVLRLREQFWQLFEALDDVGKTAFDGRVVQDVRVIESVASQLDVQRRVMTVRLNGVEIQDG